MISEITLQNLHQQLAYREERAGLSVEITHGEKRTMVSIDRGKTYFLPDSARHVEFDQMLAHYPVPVTVNGNPLSRRPYRNEAGISRSGYDGDISDTRLNSRKPIAGPYQGAIPLDGVLYAIGPCPDLKADHRYNSVTTYLLPDRQDEQPHYARSSEYYIQPNYRLDIGNGAAGWVLEGSHRRIQCQPPLEVCVSLQQQRQRQEQDALAVIRQHSGISDLGAPQQTRNEYHLSPRHEHQSCAEYPAGLILYGEPVTIARDFSLPRAAAYSITRSLYQNPVPNLVPVLSRREDRKVIGDVSCGRLTIVADDGQTYDITQAQDGSDLTAGLREHDIRRTNVKAITAHLAITYPDSYRRTVELPLDMLCDGEVYTEDVWLTDAWQAWQIDELQEILFQAYWTADNPDACPDVEGYAGELKVLATQLLAGNRPALQAQVEQLCNGFYPGSNPERIPMMTAANGQNIIIWQPTVQQDTENPPPAWLTAAVAASRPDLDSLAVFSEAGAIWGDKKPAATNCWTSCTAERHGRSSPNPAFRSLALPPIRQPSRQCRYNRLRTPAGGGVRQRLGGTLPGKAMCHTDSSSATRTGANHRMAGGYKVTNGIKAARRIVNNRITAYVVAFGTANGIMIAGFVFGWWEALFGP